MKGKAVIVAESMETGARLERTVRDAGYRVVGRFISPSPLLEAARARAKRESAAWDLVLMELSGSDWNGIDSSRQLREIFPEIEILLFTSLSAPEADVAGDPDLEDGDVSLPPAAWEMLCRLRSLTVQAQRGQSAAKRTPGRPSTFDLTRLIQKKKRS